MNLLYFCNSFNNKKCLGFFEATTIMKKTFLLISSFLLLAVVVAGCHKTKTCTCWHDIGNFVADSAKWKAAGEPFYVATAMDGSITIEDGDCSDLDKVEGPDSTHFEAEGLLMYYETRCEEK